MVIDFPAHIIFKCLCYCIGFFRAVDGNVMLIAHFADVFQEKLKVINLHHTIAAEGRKFIVCEIALSDVGAKCPGGVIGGGSAESCLARSYFSDDCAVGIFFSYRAGDYLLIVHLRTSEERLGQITAMEQDAFVGVGAVVIVPIQKGTWRPAC